LAYHEVLATHKILILAPLPDNLHPTQMPLLALPHHTVVSFEGPDAVAFAHAQFANDVTALAPGQWQWNAWLTPKGRVIALFALLRRDADSLWAVLPDLPAEDFVAPLQRFVFRRKLKIQARPELRVAGRLEGASEAQGAHFGERDGALLLDRSSDGAARSCWIGSDPHALQGVDDGLWLSQDLRDGVPRLPAGQREQWTPQQLSLDRLQAYSVKKGCYPGQEIVARTHFLGKAKRGLRLLHGKTPVSPGAAVSDGSRDVGVVVSSSAGPASAYWALAVLPLEESLAPLSVAGAPMDEQPLPGGLAR
jgi:folate-binding protein YgfZ